MIPGEYVAWLDQVAVLPSSELPCNQSTVAYAIKVAVAYRAEAQTWQDLFDELANSGAGE